MFGKFGSSKAKGPWKLDEQRHPSILHVRVHHCRALPPDGQCLHTADHPHVIRVASRKYLLSRTRSGRITTRTLTLPMPNFLRHRRKSCWVSQMMRSRLFGKLLVDPTPSMYGIFSYIWLIYIVSVGKYTIHGWYGDGNCQMRSRLTRFRNCGVPKTLRARNILKPRSIKLLLFALPETNT